MRKAKEQSIKNKEKEYARGAALKKKRYAKGKSATLKYKEQSIK